MAKALIFCEEYGSYSLALRALDLASTEIYVPEGFVKSEHANTISHEKLSQCLIDKSFLTVTVGSSLPGRLEKQLVSQLSHLIPALQVSVDSIWNLERRLKFFDLYPGIKHFLLPDMGVLSRIKSLRCGADFQYDIFYEPRRHIMANDGKKDTLVIIGEYFFSDILNDNHGFEEGSNEDFVQILEAISCVRTTLPRVNVFYKPHPSNLGAEALTDFQPLDTHGWNALNKSRCIFLGVDSRLLVEMSQAGHTVFSMRTDHATIKLGDFYQTVIGVSNCEALTIALLRILSDG